MSQNLITLMTTAAELRTGGMSWEYVAREVNRKPGTCSKWPSRYRREWNRIYLDAQRQRYEEVSNESLSYLRTLLRSKEDKTKLKSIEMVLRYGPAAIAALTGTSDNAAPKTEEDLKWEAVRAGAEDWRRRIDRERALNGLPPATDEEFYVEWTAKLEELQNPRILNLHFDANGCPIERPAGEPEYISKAEYDARREKQWGTNRNVAPEEESARRTPPPAPPRSGEGSNTSTFASSVLVLVGALASMGLAFGLASVEKRSAGRLESAPVDARGWASELGARPSLLRPSIPANEPLVLDGGRAIYATRSQEGSSPTAGTRQFSLAQSTPLSWFSHPCETAMSPLPVIRIRNPASSLPCVSPPVRLFRSDTLGPLQPRQTGGCERKSPWRSRCLNETSRQTFTNTRLRIKYMSRPAMIRVALVGVFLLSAATVQADPPADNNGVEVLARGPVHEAYAEPVDANPVAGSIVPKQPPEPIDELPPDQKPAGDHIVWLPGYWSYDTEREDFIWVSGFWRAPPPNRTWVPGSWRKLANGWQWVGGFWNVSRQEQADIEYLPEPPANVDNGPGTPAPTATSIYVPGAWVWRSRYVWRPGFWVEYKPNWIWIPAHYRWTPAGYIFIDGYWDYPLAARGMLFAPVYIPRTVYVRASYYYSPTIVVRDDCMYGALFVHRGGYYFGDYFGPTYVTAGYTSWVGYSGDRDVVVVRGYYDPMYSYYRVSYRDDPYWRTGITEIYVGRYKGDIPPPPRTLVQQNTIINNTTIVNNNVTVNNKTTNVTNVTMLSSIDSAAKVKNVQIQNVPAETRQQHMVESRQVQTFAQQRGQQETKLVAQSTPGAKLDAPRSMKLDVPKNYAARSAPAATTSTTGSTNSIGKIAPKGASSTGAPKVDHPATTTTPKVDPKPPVVNPKGPSNPGGIVVPPRQDPKAAPMTGTAGDPKPMVGTGGVGTVPTGPSLTPPPKNNPPMTTAPPPKSTPRPKPKDKEKER